MSRRILALSCLCLLSGSVNAQPTAPHVEVQAPLLFARVSGPEGTTVTFLEGLPVGRSFDSPVKVGFKPCYIHRLKLDVPTGEARVSIFASVEVRGTLRLPPRSKSSDYPAPIAVTEDDIIQVLAGTFVTKLIVVEDPDRATPAPQPEEGAEVTIPATDDPVAAAKSRGRIVAVVRLGRKEPEGAELARLGPGLILFPGAQVLQRGRYVPPHFCGPECGGFPDAPPRKPEECLRDGGDHGKPIHFDTAGQMQGLEPADSVAEYVDNRGQRRFTVTNAVCICVPRFVAVRHLVPLSMYDGVRRTIAVAGEQAHERLAARQVPGRTRQTEDSTTLRARQRAQGNTGVTPQLKLTDILWLQTEQFNVGVAALLGTDKMITLEEEVKARLARQVKLAISLSRPISPEGTIGQTTLTQAVGFVPGAGQVVGSLETREVVYLCAPAEAELPAQPLHVLKWASTPGAQVGDVVTFYIRYRNLGGKPIRDIAVSDSLTARLEYIKGSAKSDREAIFVTQENEAGSLILRWEVQQPLPPGGTGLVSFQARIR